MSSHLNLVLGKTAIGFPIWFSNFGKLWYEAIYNKIQMLRNGYYKGQLNSE